ncbi:hypothetical protein CC80DRAFT_490305 [Byssothecium circinans]|uniref:Integral membrane protein n=1 Tax=Byssothecium circinans TaxID=147558 RepID=A0A6A5U3W5_9PLEO|nr:hypothetical protein CC80DRAFT_490305 [Byssothecium circinans]
MSNGNGQHGERRPATTSSTTTTTHGPTITTTTSHTSSNPRTTITPSGPQSSTITHPTVRTTHSMPRPQPPQAPQRPQASTATQTARRPSTIGIRIHGADPSTQAHATEAHVEGNRRRSSSEPQRPQVALLDPRDDLEIRRQITATPLQTLHEGSENSVPRVSTFAPIVPSSAQQRPSFGRQASAFNLRRTQQGHEPRAYENDLVDILDVIDPAVSTLTTLNNVQNSLFIPNLGWLYNRRPTYNFSPSPPDTTTDEEQGVGEEIYSDTQLGRAPSTQPTEERPSLNRRQTSNTISSVLTGTSEGHNYAVLPHGASLPGWTAEEKAMLNDHVRHLLHSRREKFKRGMRGFGRYIRKPLGFLVTLYAFLLFLFGLAWVLFLIGWISVGGRQAYFIEICDQVLTALFCVVGIGMAPWRAIDTYHMIYVAKYAHKTWRLRKERGLPNLKDHNELPHRSSEHPWEKNEDQDPNYEAPVLRPTEQQKLEHHQNKLADSHTFYKTHETKTHNAFSVRLLIAVVVLLDCHSLFQMALGGTTWGIYYKVRPKALTAVILSCSISCNISAGITISIGDRRSRKKLVVEEMFRQEITEEALQRLRKEKGLVASGLGRKKSKSKKKGKEKEKDNA